MISLNKWPWWGHFATTNYARLHQMHHLTIQALCSEVNPLTSFFSHSSEHWHSRDPVVLSAHMSRYTGGGRQGTRPRGPLAICSTCQGACRVRPADNSPFQFTLGSRFSFRNPRPALLPSVLIPLVTPRCAQAFLFSPQCSHNLQVNNKHRLLLYATHITASGEKWCQKEKKRVIKIFSALHLRSSVLPLVAACLCSIDTVTEQQRRNEASWNVSPGFTTLGKTNGLLLPRLQLL